MRRTPHVTVLGFTVSDSVMDELLTHDKAMPIQTHKFAWNLVNSLTSAGCRVTLLSAVPASNFPRNPQIVFRRRRFQSGAVEGHLLGFVNVLVLKHVTRFLSCLVHGVKKLRSWKPDVLMVHGVHTPYLWFALLVGKVNGTKIVPVLTDPPGVVLPSDGSAASLLKRIDIWVVKQALRRVDGVVTLTAALARDFARGVPSLTMEGISAGSAGTDRRRGARSGDEFNVLYAGGLTATYGVDRLVEAVRQLPHPELRLHVYGRGDLSPWINQQASEDARIQPPRFLDSHSLQNKLGQADVLINPRPVDQDFVKYSFPSKLIEYLAAGTTVITTKLPGIPDDYDNNVVYTDHDTPDAMARAIEAVMAMDPQERQARNDAARDFIRTTRSPDSQGRKIANFLATL